MYCTCPSDKTSRAIALKAQALAPNVDLIGSSSLRAGWRHGRPKDIQWCRTIRPFISTPARRPTAQRSSVQASDASQSDFHLCAVPVKFWRLASFGASPMLSNSCASNWSAIKLAIMFAPRFVK